MVAGLCGFRVRLKSGRLAGMEERHRRLMRSWLSPNIPIPSRYCRFLAENIFADALRLELARLGITLPIGPIGTAKMLYMQFLSRN